MRFKKKKIDRSVRTRTVTKFCWLPTRVGDEYIWLETVTLKQVSEHRFDVTSGTEWIEWHNVCEV